MNIRFPHSVESAPPAASAHPPAILRLDARIRLIASMLGLAAAVALVWYLIAPAPVKEAPPPPVMVSPAQRTDVTVVEHTLGTVVANATVQVTARVDGQMMFTGFKEGDIVRAGQLIFQLDPRPFKAALLQAEAALAKDQAMLVSARNDRTRYDTLFKAGAASSQQRDQADASAKALAAAVQADRAAVDVARLNLAYTQIRSPIDGKTGPILVQPGNLVTANGTSPLVTITQIQPVKVSFSLPQSDLPRIQERRRANALTAAVDVHDSTGRAMVAPVDFVGNAVSNATGTIELRATFPNADMSLVPGQLVDVAVALASLRGAIVVPRDAVNVGPDGRYVYVVNDAGKAELRKVTVRFDNGATMAVGGDLKAGERVITDGQLRVNPGKPVEILRPGAARGPAQKAP
ncbi:MAG TPA: efflux RND transporter periplasmic adaptor subunit [Rhizomicrobium sp.]|nr:efflux RND transporter periplasmic adaptor subunit [Rhizomicrobium sp.]